MEKEYLTLEEKLKNGELKVEEFNTRYNKLKSLESALKELLVGMGG